MKKVTLLLLLLICKPTFSQNVGVLDIFSPVTGCTLSVSETVTVLIFNQGPAGVSGKIPVSYTVNGGTPVNDTLDLGATVLSNGSSYTFPFSVPVDLSAPGTYSIDAYTSLSGDPNQSNDTLSDNPDMFGNPRGPHIVNSDPLSVGGNISGSDTVCSNANGDTLVLTGHTGLVQRWESSINGGASWTNIANTTDSLKYNNLTVETLYRVLVKSGTCSAEYSDTAKIMIDMPSVGGTISGDTTVCNPNSDTLKLTGYTGAVLNWESSTDNGISWLVIPNTTDTLSYLNLADTTYYRSIVKNGSCPAVFSDTAIINVSPATVPGKITPKNTVACSGSNTGILSLLGNIGTVVRWEFSEDNGVSWTNILITDSTFTYSNLITTTLYRVLVKSCSPEYSDTAVVTIDPVSVGGSISGSATVCQDSNSGNLTLSGQNGNIIKWESSINGTSWSNTGSLSNPQPYNNLQQTTFYRAIVQSGVCPADTSSIATITVDSITAGGKISSSASVCISGNNDTLILNGYRGNIIRWEFFDGVTWVPIANTTNKQGYTNLLQTTMFRALVQNGVCISTYSDTATITVNPLSDAGVISGSDTVCYQNNNDTILISGFTGNVLKWQSSNDSLVWNDIVNTTPQQIYTGLTQTTYYRSIVQSAGCPADTSPTARVVILPKTVNAGNDTTINVGESVTLNGSGGVSYSWTPVTALSNAAIANPVAKPVVTTIYILTVTDSNSCVTTDSVTITVNANFNFIIPNLITRNGDDINDTWEIKTIEAYSTSEVVIFNVYGQEVFSEAPYLNKWNGTSNGNTLPDGTYYYILRFSDSDKIFKGSITILSGK